MGKIKDLTEMTFDKLTVICRAEDYVSLQGNQGKKRSRNKIFWRI